MRLLKLVPDDTNIRVLGWRMPFYAISILLIIASWALAFTNGLNYGVPIPELLDLSVNETLARTVMTSLTLLVALMPLLLFGPDSLFGLMAAIMLGIFVGTYSSVHMAAPLLIRLGVSSDSFVPKESVADVQERKARGQV